MSVRTLEAPDGERWRVWEVVPGRVSEFRSSRGSHLPPEMAEGWLCFESGTEKRRLAPLPHGWQERSDPELWSWCRAAAPVRPRLEPQAAPDPARGDAAAAAAEPPAAAGAAEARGTG